MPEVPTDPWANVYYSVKLTRPPAGFRGNRAAGLVVQLFADLKRHDLGPGLAESFAAADARTNREYTTARLWGVADTAPYLHDGRATTLTEAILAHGGDAQDPRDNFFALSDAARSELLEFLRSLRHAEADTRRWSCQAPPGSLTIRFPGFTCSSTVVCPDGQCTSRRSTVCSEPMPKCRTGRVEPA